MNRNIFVLYPFLKQQICQYLQEIYKESINTTEPTKINPYIIPDELEILNIIKLNVSTANWSNRPN
jgi:hypothetical protein